MYFDFFLGGGCASCMTVSWGFEGMREMAYDRRTLCRDEYLLGLLMEEMLLMTIKFWMISSLDWFSIFFWSNYNSNKIISHVPFAKNYTIQYHCNRSKTDYFQASRLTTMRIEATNANTSRIIPRALGYLVAEVSLPLDKC